MRYCLKKTCRRNRCPLVVALLLLASGLPGKANVYATDIKLNGSTNNAAIAASEPDTTVLISYILNEPATNVWLQIHSGAAVVWTGSLAGTNTGSNSVAWGGTNQAGQIVVPGVYQFSITASSSGYAGWTNITDDSPHFAVYEPTGIAVNQNSNSPFYGRVFAGNAPPNSAAGIFKFNADGSPADEGGFSRSYPWPGGQYDPGYLYSPWKIAVAPDDTVYINDWSQSGLVLAFDEVISTNYLTALNSGNYPYQFPPAGPQLSGPCVTGGGGGTQLWMADANTDGHSVGVLRYDLTANGAVADNDTGTVVVGISPTGLTLCAYDVAVDASSNIYVIQSLDGFADPGDYFSTPRLFCFPPYSNTTELTTNWSVSSEDHSLENAVGVAVDPTGTWVAVAVRGYNDGSGGELPNGVAGLKNGAVNVYYATNGALVASLGGGTNDQFMGVAWDHVGNLYATDLSAQVWRTWSPPGTNQAVTPAAPVIQVYNTLTQPSLCSPVAPVAPASPFGFTLQGQSNVTYVIECSPDLVTWTPIATNYDTVDLRYITVPAPCANSFFQARVQ
jgi:hypothetical protein